MIVQYLEWLRVHRNRSPQTLKSYASTLEAWLEWCGMRPLGTLERSEMEQFLERTRLRRGKGRMGSPATRKREASCLRTFYAWMVNQGHLDRSPALGLVGPTVHDINPKPVPDDLWLYVWGSEKTADADRLVLGLGFFCGLRRAEMVRVRGAQITNTRILDFVRKGGGEHTVPWADMVGALEDGLPDFVGATEPFVSAMLAARKRGDELALPWVVNPDPQTINKRLYSLQRRLGIEEDEWFTPHQLRHSCATNLLRAGVPLHLVSRLLNHTNPSITMRYVRAGADELRAWRSGNRGNQV